MIGQQEGSATTRAAEPSFAHVFAVDASVTLAWLFEDEATPFTESILDRLVYAQAWVPALWALECVNVLAGAQRRGRMDASMRTALLERALALPLLMDREPVGMRAIDALSSEFELTAYDAAYLELAMRRGLTLVTLDRDLIRAARRAGVPVETARE